MRRVLRENGLSIMLISLFLLFWVGQSVAGHREYNAEQREHGEPEAAYTAYPGTSHFWEATAENWESEFLQIFPYVFLTAFLFQKGSAESKSWMSPSRWIAILARAATSRKPRGQCAAEASFSSSTSIPSRSHSSCFFSSAFRFTL